MKNINKRRLKLWVVTLSLCMAALSCSEEFLEIPLPSNSLNSEGAFSSMGAIEQMMNQVYTDFTGIISNNAGFEAYADNGYNARTEDEFTIANLTPEDDGIIPWGTLYRVIYNANLMIEGLPTADAIGLEDATRNEYIAASKTMRAFAYYQLVRLYGDVPLITTTSVEENQFRPRDPKAEVYTQIENDLLDAMAKLPSTLGERYYINNKFIPQAILADVYLTQEKWEKAEAAADAVISSGNYLFDNNLDNLFLRLNNSAIMVTGNLIGVEIREKMLALPGGDSYPKAYGPFFGRFFENIAKALTVDLLNSFEPGDLRKDKWVELNNTSGYPNPNERMFSRKYKLFGANFNGPVPTQAEAEDNKFIRLAEVILIRAESRAHLNDLDGAADDLNTIRNRAGLDDTEASSQTDLIDAIIKERRVEFFFEKGIRWFDLVRTGKADAILSAIPYKTEWTAGKVLMPIPLDQINLSANKLTQNPAYN